MDKIKAVAGLLADHYRAVSPLRRGRIEGFSACFLIAMILWVI
jgi:tetrahydromethanopterin S-methyltransferase subunit F